MTKSECDYLINIFDKSTRKIDGMSGSGLDYKKKKSKDLGLSFVSNDSTEDIKCNNLVLPKITHCLSLYKKKYPFIDEISKWNIDYDYNIQKFETGEGYFKVHCEQESITPKRILVWMIYLNNAKCGTKFYYQNVTMKARAGRIVIWPAGWTHMHSGVVPNKGDKYIVTGWFSFI